MNQLFKQRTNYHQLRMQRYLKYVFNDHFALLMTFLLGAAGLYYSNILKTIATPFPLGQWIVWGIWLSSLAIGRYASLTQEADQVFLLPKEAGMRQYLAAALRYSCYLPFGVAVLIIGATMPLYVVATGQSFSQFFWLVLSSWLLKISQLYVQQFQLFQFSETRKKQVTIAYWLSSAVIVGVMAFFLPLIGVVLAAGQVGVMSGFLGARMNARLDWERLIDTEQKRLYRIYRFINLFTDVPQVKGTIKRRQYLDGLVAKIPQNQEHVYFHLYARRFIRGTEFSGLWLRLVGIGSLCLWFSSDYRVSGLVGIVFLYMIGFQMIPLYQQFQYMPLTQIYPVRQAQQYRSFQQMLRFIMGSATIILALVGGIALHNWTHWGFVIVSYVCFDWLFLQIYVPKRLKKMTN